MRPVCYRVICSGLTWRQVRFQQRVAEEMTKKAAREELTKKSASVERLQKSAHDLLAKNVSRVDSEPVPVHHNHDDIFEMDDFELDRDNDTAYVLGVDRYDCPV